jgi:hypothetical protein
MFFPKGTHLVFASFCAGACVKMARGMRVHVRENVEIGLLTFVEEGLYPQHCTYNDSCKSGRPNVRTVSAISKVTPNQGGGGYDGRP